MSEPDGLTATIEPEASTDAPDEAIVTPAPWEGLRRPAVTALPAFGGRRDPEPEPEPEPDPDPGEHDEIDELPAWRAAVVERIAPDLLPDPPTEDAMATTADVARMFITDLGATPTPETIRAVQIWLRFESGSNIIGNNPWNLHAGRVAWAGMTGSRYAGPGDKAVAVFGSLREGVAASAQNLINLSGSGYGYDRVIAAIRSGSGPATLAALGNSSWSAGRYKDRNGVKGGKLFAAWNAGVPADQRITFTTPKAKPAKARPLAKATPAKPKVTASLPAASAPATAPAGVDLRTLLILGGLALAGIIILSLLLRSARGGGTPATVIVKED